VNVLVKFYDQLSIWYINWIQCASVSHG